MEYLSVDIFTQLNDNPSHPPPPSSVVSTATVSTDFDESGDIDDDLSTVGDSKSTSRASTKSEQTSKKTKKSSSKPASQKNPESVKRRNARERRRVNQVNHAFVSLRDHIPCATLKTKKMSKVDTLRNAAEYILYLQEVLASSGECDPSFDSAAAHRSLMVGLSSSLGLSSNQGQNQVPLLPPRSLQRFPSLLNDPQSKASLDHKPPQLPPLPQQSSPGPSHHSYSPGQTVPSVQPLPSAITMYPTSKFYPSRVVSFDPPVNNKGPKIDYWPSQGQDVPHPSVSYSQQQINGLPYSTAPSVTTSSLPSCSTLTRADIPTHGITSGFNSFNAPTPPVYLDNTSGGYPAEQFFSNNESLQVSYHQSTPSRASGSGVFSNSYPGFSDNSPHTAFSSSDNSFSQSSSTGYHFGSDLDCSTDLHISNNSMGHFDDLVDNCRVLPNLIL